MEDDILEADATATLGNEPEAIEPDDPNDTPEGSEDADTTDDDQEGDESLQQEIETTLWVGDDGVEYNVPTAVVPSLMKNKDYTQKTQGIAQTQRELAAMREEIEIDRQRTAEDLQVDAEIAYLEAQAKQYAQLNWQQLAQEDMYAAQQRQFERQTINERIGELKNIQNSRRTERQEKARQETDKRIQSADEYARANIPNWDKGVDGEYIRFARDLGIDEATLSKVVSPAFIKLLHRAKVGDAALRRVTAPKSAQKGPVTPATQVRAKSTKSDKNPADMSMEEYAKWSRDRFKQTG